MFMASPRPGGTWETTMTGDSEIITVTKGPDGIEYGYDGGVDYYSGTGFGSLSDSTFRGETIESITWHNFDDAIRIIMSGNGLIKNLFWKLDVDGVEYLTEDASHADFGTGTMWGWTGVTSNPFSGTHAIRLSYTN